MHKYLFTEDMQAIFQHFADWLTRKRRSSCSSECPNIIFAECKIIYLFKQDQLLYTTRTVDLMLSYKIQSFYYYKSNVTSYSVICIL